MAKKIVGLIKLEVPAGKASPAPPIGPALGQRGLNIMEFCKAFNAQTQKVEPGLPLPVVITAYADKSFSFIIKTPPTTVLIKKAAGIESGSPRPHTDKVGKITKKQVEEIANVKMPDLNAANLEAATRTVAGTGKKVRVAVFAQGDKAQAAKAAGAELVGMEDLAETIKGGSMEFDVVIAAPEAMRVVGQLGQILGPRGLMPNPKVGTVTPDVAAAVKNAKGGQVQFRADKTGIVQCTIGRASFTPEQLRDNLGALLDALNKSKPASTKGIFLKKVSVSSTMGLGVKVDPASLSAQAQ